MFRGPKSRDNEHGEPYRINETVVRKRRPSLDFAGLRVPTAEFRVPAASHTCMAEFRDRRTTPFTIDARWASPVDYLPM